MPPDCNCNGPLQVSFSPCNEIVFSYFGEVKKLKRISTA